MNAAAQVGQTSQSLHLRSSTCATRPPFRGPLLCAICIDAAQRGAQDKPQQWLGIQAAQPPMRGCIARTTSTNKQVGNEGN